MSAVFAMLAWKSWRESRSRFLLAAACVATLCVAFVLFQSPLRAHVDLARSPLDTYDRYVYLRVYGGFVRGAFLYLVLILGLGGLQRERAQRTIGFTLALPATRLQLFGARAAVGVAEVVLVAAIPALLVPTLSSAVGHGYPAAQALRFALLWVAVGATVFAFAVLVSTLVASEYAALSLALVGFYLYPLAVVYTPFLRGRPVHIHYIMNGRGMPYLDPRTDLLVGAMPWRILAGVAIAALLMLAWAAWATTRQELA